MPAIQAGVTMTPMGPALFSRPTPGPGHRLSVTGAGGRSDGLEVSVRVLVVDDDPRVRAALGQTIALESDLVLLAAVGDHTAALAWAESADPSVALIDVVLSDDTSGLALIRLLAQRPGWAVVAMSLHSGLRGAALAAGAASFVEKSGDIDAVLAAVRRPVSPGRA
jgi:DNA-binding NtrC family response regulator